MAKGFYTPKHPEKYRGDPTKIRFLSSWEARMMSFCDTNPNVLEWASEEIRIKYWNPFKSKVCDYIPDFLIKYRNTKGEIVVKLIEVKPSKEDPRYAASRKRISTYDKASMILNHAKWTAAKAFCDKAGIEFTVLTEMDMFK